MEFYLNLIGGTCKNREFVESKTLKPMFDICWIPVAITLYTESKGLPHTLAGTHSDIDAYTCNCKHLLFVVIKIVLNIVYSVACSFVIDYELELLEFKSYQLLSG